jgi:hypothetical protein
MLENSAEHPGGISMSTTIRSGISLAATAKSIARINGIDRSVRHIPAAARHCRRRVLAQHFKFGAALQAYLFATSNALSARPRVCVAVALDASMRQQRNPQDFLRQHL